MWDQLDATISYFIVNHSATCFGRLYAHPQEVRLRFHCIWLPVLLWLLWCWRVGWQAVCTVWGSQATYPTQCTQLASWLSNITTGQINICSENAVWPPEDGRYDAWNMSRNNWLTIKSPIVASSWSHIYLLIKDARSLENKHNCVTKLSLLICDFSITNTQVIFRMYNTQVFSSHCNESMNLNFQHQKIKSVT